MTSPIKQIAQLPNVLDNSLPKRSLSSLSFCEVYCHILYVEMPPTGPLRIFVTDFTSNQNISNPNYSKEIDINNVTIPDDQILRVDVFSDKLDLLMRSYKELTGIDLIRDLNSQYDPFSKRYNTYQKMWIVKLGISLKKYNSTIEARMKFIQNGGLSDKNPYLIELYKNIMNLPGEVLHENINAVNRSIPLEFHEGLNIFIREKVLKKAELDLKRARDTLKTSQQFHDALEPGQSKSSNSSNSPEADVEVPVSRVKNEILSDDIVPDTLFGNDYANSSPPPQDDDEDDNDNDNDLHFASLKYHSFKFLNQEIKNADQGKMYRVNAYVQSVTPKDWSFTCVKGYRQSYINNKIELSDPFIRSMEFILTESLLENNDNDMVKVLVPDDFLTVYLEGEQIANFFKINELENLYTTGNKFSEKFYSLKKRQPIELDLFKKDININKKDKLLVWSVRNFSIDDLGIESPL